MKPNLLEISDNLLYHSEPPFPDSVISYGIQQLTKSPYNHIATVINLNPVQVIEAVASGYKIHNIQDSITASDKRVSVFRYHADSVGGLPLTDIQKAGIIQTALQYQNAPSEHISIPLLVFTRFPKNIEIIFFCIAIKAFILDSTIPSIHSANALSK